MASILIVDSDDYTRQLMKDDLETQDHRAVEALNGAGAQALINAGDVDLVLQDFNAQNDNEIQLLAYSKQVNAKIPFVFVAGFAEIDKMLEAYAHGADDFLIRPFNGQDVKQVIERMLGFVKPDEVARLALDPALGERPILDPLFCRFSLHEMQKSNRFEVDVYLRLSAAKYIKIARGGLPIDRKQTNRYKDKGADSLFILRKDLERADPLKRVA